MNKKIGLVHATINSVQPIVHAFQKHHPSVDLVHMMDEGLIWELNETNTITKNMIRRLIDLAGKAENAGVDGILFTCSAFSPDIRKFKHLFQVPTLSPDESMLKEAVEIGGRIGVVVTVEKSAATITKQLHELAEERGQEINVESVAIPEAFQVLQKTDPTKHDELIHAEIEKIHQRSDVVVLGQFSMARALETYEGEATTPILTSPEISANAIVRLAEE